MIGGRLKIAADISNDEGDAGGQGLLTVNDSHGVTGLILPDGPEPDPIRVSQSEAPQDTIQRPEMDVSPPEFLPGAINDSAAPYSFQHEKRSL